MFINCQNSNQRETKTICPVHIVHDESFFNHRTVSDEPMKEVASQKLVACISKNMRIHVGPTLDLLRQLISLIRSLAFAPGIV
jgi:hypothetical protein